MAAVATTIGLSSTTSGFWQSVDSTTNARYFNIGFMYQTGFDEYKTACAADITCDLRSGEALMACSLLFSTLTTGPQ